MLLPNTQTEYLKILETNPALAKELQKLILATVLDCRNAHNEGSCDIEASIRNVGKRADNPDEIVRVI